MTLEEIKLILCKNEELIKKLKQKHHQLIDDMKNKAIEIKSLDEYHQYINDQDSEEKKQKLFQTSQCQELFKQKNKLEDIEKQIENEQNKCDEKEFEEVNKKASCDHLFYQIDETKKICIKCGHIDGDKKSSYEGIKNLKLTYLYIELFDYYKNYNKKYSHISPLLQCEPLKHIVLLTSETLRKYPGINNELLERKLENEVADVNIGFLEGMFTEEKHMDSDMLEIYNTYKKLIRNKTI